MAYKTNRQFNTSQKDYNQKGGHQVAEEKKEESVQKKTTQNKQGANKAKTDEVIAKAMNTMDADTDNDQVIEYEIVDEKKKSNNNAKENHPKSNSNNGSDPSNSDKTKNNKSDKNAESVEIEDIISYSDLQKKVEIYEAVAGKDKQRIAELSSLVDRMQIDFDNFRKRTREEAKAKKEQGYAEVIEKVLPTLDVLDKATTMIKDKDEKVAEGIRMISQQLEQSLKEFGLIEIDALGQIFNPKFHNALMQSPTKDPDKSGCVIEVLQKGYMIGDKVVRPAAVAVGK